MRNIILSTAFLLTAFISNAQKTVINDPNAEARTISGSFSAVKVSGGIDLYLSQYETESIAVSATKPEYRDKIKTEIENGTLRIYYDQDWKWNQGNKKLKVYVSFKNLEKITASGASDVHVAGSINVPSLALSMSGASDFKGAVKVEKLSLDLSGASDANISGSAGKVDIESSGASDVKGFDLVSDYCTAKASGASDIKITVNKELNARASGASDIHYKGSCVIRDLHSSGASSVGRKG